ncbi:hypothetical protein LCGC14_2969960, partial [marine sediment metagenome]
QYIDKDPPGVADDLLRDVKTCFYACLKERIALVFEEGVDGYGNPPHDLRLESKIKTEREIGGDLGELYHLAHEQAFGQAHQRWSDARGWGCGTTDAALSIIVHSVLPVPMHLEMIIGKRGCALAGFKGVPDITLVHGTGTIAWEPST